MQKIIADIDYLAVQALDSDLELLPVGGKFCALCQLALQGRQLLFMLAKAMQRGDRAAVGEGRKTGNPHIYTDGGR